ncbi:uncharacterized protein LOC129607916 [Condylostylus longicornis]|uniref:uncharacterized protein LOC129607916 n=1 Tax=Condylostylus longicornis TaxID=2530218 RepID=UPI00244DEF64|nr:uncharacterized protein LOC129607916 [Condylostylus longicornis]
MKGKQTKLNFNDFRECCVPNCIGKKKNSSSSKLISFPRNQEINAIWGFNCKVDKTRGKFICLSHFEKRFIGLNTLKPDALPTIFDWHPIFKDLPKEVKRKPHSTKRKCCIKDCVGSLQKRALFKFPEFGESTKDWYVNCGFHKDCNVEDKFICERHFRTSDLYEGKLKKNSVPVLNLNNVRDYTNKKNMNNKIDENKDLTPDQENIKDEDSSNVLDESLQPISIETAFELLSDTKHDLIDFDPIGITAPSIYATKKGNMFIEPASDSNPTTLLDAEENIVIENVPVVEEPYIISPLLNEENSTTTINLTEQSPTNSDCEILSDTECDNVLSSQQNVLENMQNSSDSANYSLDSTVRNTNIEIFSNVENTIANCNPNDFYPVDDLSDPAKWPELTDEIINKLIRIGPTQIVNFKNTGQFGKFDPVHYQRRLVNGNTVPRPWLVYSISKNAVYCFCCVIFKRNENIIEQIFCRNGFNDWQHISLWLQMHETNKIHVQNFKSWKLLEKSMINNLNENCISEKKSEILFWKKLVRKLLPLVKFLGIQSLPFQGTSETLHKTDNGNFLKLVEAFAGNDEVLRQHLENIKAGMQEEYIGKSIQNDLIHLIANSVKQKIVSMVKTAKYYAIIVDSVSDKNLVERISLTIRFVHQEKNNFYVKELFLGFLGKKDEVGEKLWDLILQELKKLQLSISDCRGQSYDYNSSRIVKEYNIIGKSRVWDTRIFCVPSKSHNINFVVSDSFRSCSLDAIELFESVQNLYTFLNCSSSRWKIYTTKFPFFTTLEPLSDIRWATEIGALKPLRYNLKEIYEVLLEISDKESLEITIAVESLANKIFNFKFICSLFVWYDILEKVNGVSIYFQENCICLSYAILLLETTIQFLMGLKLDQIFNAYVSDAENYAKSLLIPHTFPIQTFSNFRKVNICMEDPKCSFKTNYYLKILNESIDSLKERCEQLKTHANLMSFLIDKNGYDNNVNLGKYCKKLETALTYNGSKDLDAQELESELRILSPLIEPYQPVIEILNYIFQSNLANVFPNTVIAFTILSTLSINVAPDISKSKLIRAYLKSITTEDISIDLPILSIEKEIVEMLDFDYLAEEFAKSKATSDIK